MPLCIKLLNSSISAQQFLKSNFLCKNYFNNCAKSNWRGLHHQARDNKLIQNAHEYLEENSTNLKNK